MAAVLRHTVVYGAGLVCGVLTAVAVWWLGGLPAVFLMTCAIMTRRIAFGSFDSRITRGGKP